MVKIASLVIIVGSLIFLVAAFSPISRVFGMPSSEAKWQLLSTSRIAWAFSQVLFAAGGIVTAVGIVLAAVSLQGRPAASAFHVAGGLMLIGAIAWTWSVYLRTIDPRGFIAGNLPTWPFVLYALFTMAALALIGYSLLQMGFPSWSAWLLIGCSLALFTLYIMFHDMPPAVYYLLCLILGLVLHRAG